MINALNGTIVEASDGRLVICVSGIEFNLDVSSECVRAFAPKKGTGDVVRVLTVYTSSEHAQNIYGFKDERERECFIELTKVPGLAGKGALKILSSISVDDFVQALDRRDVSRLSKIPGVGSKTAQKLILQLRNTLVYTDDEPGDRASASDYNASSFDDVVESFVGMGYDKKAVLKALERILAKEAKVIEGLDQEAAENHIFPLLLRSL